MKHLSEEELVLYYYGESDAAASTESHLRECGSCGDEYHALAQLLRDVAAAEVPERDDTYGSRVWKAIAPRLGANKSRVWLAAAAAILLLVAGAFLAGRYSALRDEGGRTAEVRERVLLVALGEHLDRSQMLLLEVVNAAEAGGLPRDSARELVRESRLYRQTAFDVGDVATIDALEELERILLDIAHGASSTADLRARIDEQDVLFKIRVLQTNVRQREVDLKPRKF